MSVYPVIEKIKVNRDYWNINKMNNLNCRPESGPAEAVHSLPVSHSVGSEQEQLRCALGPEVEQELSVWGTVETHQRLKYFFYEDYISIRSRYGKKYFQIWNHLYFIELLKRWYELKCSMLLKGKKGRGVRYYQKIFNSSLDNLIHKYNAFVSFNSV